MRFSWIILLSVLLVVRASAQTDDLVPCAERPHALDQPWTQPGLACLEEVFNDATFGVLAFAVLTVSDDGTLYAADPTTGNLYKFSDTDGDLLPDMPEILVGGLPRPTGLTFYDGAVYIAAQNSVFRYQNSVLETLIDTLPTQFGYWNGGIAVHDGRLYIGATDSTIPCDAGDRSECGAVLSYTLDGTDRQVVQNGLAQPYDLVFVDNTFWLTDTARDSIVNDTNLNFSLQPDSTPLGIAHYNHDAIPSLTGKLLITLNGSFDSVNLTGYQLLSFDPLTHAIIALMPFAGDERYDNLQMNLRGSGFFPQRPLDVAVSPEGWVYISITDGRILALRPN